MSTKIAAIPEKNPGATAASNHPSRSGGVPTAENTGYTIDGQYVWIPYVPVTDPDSV